MDFIMLQLKDLFVALFTGPESGEFIYPSLCSQWMLCIKAKDLCKVKFKRYLPWHETNVFSSCVKMVIRARHGGFGSFQPVLFVGQCPDFAFASIGGKENCGKTSKDVEFLKQLQIFLKGKKAGNSSVVVYGAY